VTRSDGPCRPVSDDRDWAREAGAELARRTRREQGLDDVVRDPGALARLAALILAPALGSGPAINGGFHTTGSSRR